MRTNYYLVLKALAHKCELVRIGGEVQFQLFIHFTVVALLEID